MRGRPHHRLPAGPGGRPRRRPRADRDRRRRRPPLQRLHARAGRRRRRLPRDAGPGERQPARRHPVVWANRLLHRGLDVPADRVRGPDLFLDVFDGGQAAGLRHYLLGSTPTCSRRWCARWASASPAHVVGSESPPFRALTEAERDAQAERIRASGAQVVWVGLGTPKQDWECARLRARLPAVFVAVGAAFDFAAGTKSSAPRWMQDHGLEWVHRLGTEPRRLWRRNLFGEHALRRRGRASSLMKVLVAHNRYRSDVPVGEKPSSTPRSRRCARPGRGRDAAPDERRRVAALPRRAGVGRARTGVRTDRGAPARRAGRAGAAGRRAPAQRLPAAEPLGGAHGARARRPRGADGPQLPPRLPSRARTSARAASARTAPAVGSRAPPWSTAATAARVRRPCRWPSAARSTAARGGASTG